MHYSCAKASSYDVFAGSYMLKQGTDG